MDANESSTAVAHTTSTFTSVLTTSKSPLADMTIGGPASALITGTVSSLVVVSNIVNLIVISKMKNVRTSTRYIYISLSVSDLLVGLWIALAIEPSYLGRWPYSITECYIMAYFLDAMCAVSIYTLALLSLERCLIVCFPLKNRFIVTKRRVFAVIALIWSASLAFSIWPFFTVMGNDYGYRNSSFICSMKYELNLRGTLIGMISVIFASGIIILTCWGLIFGIAKAHRMRLVRINSMSASRSRSQGWKQVRTILAVTTAYYVAWIPFAIRQIYLAAVGEPDWFPLDFIISWLAISNSFWNSVIYVFTDNEYKRVLVSGCVELKKFILRLFECKSCCCNRQANETHQSVQCSILRKTNTASTQISTVCAV